MGYATQGAREPLNFFEFQRRELRAHDIQLEILYCGICHSDIHNARNEWHNAIYPMVPGHEIVGKVTKIGEAVSEFKVGDLAAVGCLVGSCQKCKNCGEGLEQYCENGFTLTYNSKDPETAETTYGGFSNTIVVNDKFVLHLPKELDIKAAAPLLCAGITTYSPLRHWKVAKGQKVGVVGLGGLGHMAVKFAHAFGAEVTVITTSPSKEQDARKLGASNVIISKDQRQMQKEANSFDFILNTVPRSHDMNPYLDLLKRDCVMVIVGAVEPIEPGVDGSKLVFKRRSIAGSLIGGLKETQEMLNFCAEHNVLPQVEMIPIQKVNEAFERTIKNDVKYRFVIDMASLREESA